MEAGSAHLVIVLAQGTRHPRNENPARRTARAGWRSFGEYIFLEDSRYASQREKSLCPGRCHSASKTRVNALMAPLRFALHRIRDTVTAALRRMRAHGGGLGLISLRGKARYILCRWPKAPTPSRARTS